MVRYLGIIIVIMLALFALGLIFGVAGAEDDDAMDRYEQNKKQAIEYAQSRLKKYIEENPIEVMSRLESMQEQSARTTSDEAASEMSLYEMYANLYVGGMYFACVLGAGVGSIWVYYFDKKKRSVIEEEIEEEANNMKTM